MSKKNPKPWKLAQTDEINKIQGVCLDIDDTLSTDGKLTSEAYRSLWNLKEAGFVVVPLTGRPAGWCDHIARFWPVDAVVGENGAFSFFMEAGVRKRLNTPAGFNQKELKEKLKELSQKLESQFPKLQWASDQPYREYDLAIDVCEDVSPWPAAEKEALLEFCRLQGAHAKLSSIHVNVWYGDYDKKKGFDHWIQRTQSKNKDISLERWLFIGDSPNDEPLFAAFPYSVGVANLKNYLSRLHSLPTWITPSESGKGFSEMVKKLLACK
jgi:HAD superfamily hydrolase (TIGR01484 family)